MSLHEKILAFKEQFLSQVPAEKVAIMQKATLELEDSGILSKLPGAGDRAPDFTLSDAEGQQFSLASLFATGPVVLTFYRGVW